MPPESGTGTCTELFGSDMMMVVLLERCNRGAIDSFLHSTVSVGEWDSKCGGTSVTRTVIAIICYVRNRRQHLGYSDEFHRLRIATFKQDNNSLEDHWTV